LNPPEPATGTLDTSTVMLFERLDDDHLPAEPLITP
jgi:hypothetical protein